MAIGIAPIIGQWYKNLGGLRFEVVVVDEDTGTIGVQYCDGVLDELDFDIWAGMNIDNATQPGDWSAPFSDLESDDLGYTDMGIYPAGHIPTLNDLEE